MINRQVVREKFPDWFAVLRGSRHYQNSENTKPKLSDENQQTDIDPVTNDQYRPTKHENARGKQQGHSTENAWGQQQGRSDTENARGQQQGHSDTDDDERDIVMQMETENGNNHTEVTEQFQNFSTSHSEHGSSSSSLGRYDTAMASLERVSQMQTQMENLRALRIAAPPVRDRLWQVVTQRPKRIFQMMNWNRDSRGQWLFQIQILKL